MSSYSKFAFPFRAILDIFNREHGPPRLAVRTETHFHSCLYGINFTDFAKELRMPTVIIRPASMRIYRNSTVRYATQ